MISNEIANRDGLLRVGAGGRLVDEDFNSNHDEDDDEEDDDDDESLDGLNIDKGKDEPQ